MSEDKPVVFSFSQISGMQIVLEICGAGAGLVDVQEVSELSSRSQF